MSCCRSQRGGFAWHRCLRSAYRAEESLSAIDSTAQACWPQGWWCFWKAKAIAGRISKRHLGKVGDLPHLSELQASWRADGPVASAARSASRRPTWGDFLTLSMGPRVDIGRVCGWQRPSVAAYSLSCSSHLDLSPQATTSHPHHHPPIPIRHDCFLVSLLPCHRPVLVSA